MRNASGRRIVSLISEGYYYYGASAGRDWFIDPANKFKDQSIPEPDLELLDRVLNAISDLLEEPKFKHFTWLGSGLQKHYGHVTGKYHLPSSYLQS
jgi:hypothetical protein